MLRLRSTSLLLLLAGVSVACDKKEEEAKPSEARADQAKDDAEDAKAEPAEAGEESSKVAAAQGDGAADAGAVEGGEAAEPEGDAELPAAGEPGPAYFAVKDKGVFVLNEGEFSQVKGGPDKLVKQMQVGPDGAVYLLGFDGIMKIDEAKAKLVAKTEFKTTGSVDAFDVVGEGEFWAVGFKGISHFAGGKWTTEEKTVLGEDVTLLKGVVVDGENRVWIASSNALHLRDGDAWNVVDVSKVTDRKPFFNSLSVGPEGIAYAAASNALLKLNAPDSIEAVELNLSGFTSFDQLDFAANGIGALKTQPKAVMAMMPSGDKVEYEAGKDFASDRIVALTVDGQGRLWVANDEGVAILGPGEQKVEWKSGSVEQLAGQVEDIVVVGAGPELPQVGPVKKGGLKGKILAEGKGLANTQIEMCPKPDSMFEKSPCDDSTTRFSATTDADGNFEFSEVPLGAYGVAVKVGEKWQITFGSEYGAEMKEGETLDIGSIKVKQSS